MNPWLFSYHPIAPFLVFAIMGAWMALAGLLCSLFLSRFPRYGFFGAASAWVSCEFGKTLGFTAYPYGILGYSQWRNAPLLSGAAVWGVWGSSFLLTACSAFIAQCALAYYKARKRKAPAREFAMSVALPACCFLCAACIAHGAGFLVRTGTESGADSLRVLSIQADLAPRKDGSLPARYYADRLMATIRSGLAAYPETQLIVTSETAFPPSIELRMLSPSASDDDRAVADFMRFLSSTGRPAIVGNDHGSYGMDIDGKTDRLHFNAALLIHEGNIRSIYKKARLVPFIEYFPFPGAFPALYRYIKGQNGMLWTPGDSQGPIVYRELSIGTPICYEDCFGDACRALVRAGARVLIPMASDAWSGSGIAMRQHLAACVFRSVESKLPVLRVSNNGISCLISPDGAVSHELPSFVSGYSSVKLDIPSSSGTPYLRFGDWFAQACIVITLIFLVILAFRSMSGNGTSKR
jgi:apolipoprotein N-acyltransferase